MGNANGQSIEPRLVLEDESGQRLFDCPMQDNGCFGIRYVHSVAQTPVEDWFCIRQKQIHLEATIYQDFGAGLPHSAGEGQKMTFENGHIRLDGFQTLLPSFDVRVGRVARHTLLLPRNATRESIGNGGERRTIPLDSLLPPGRAITFSIR